jgi:hypothetical protein
MDRKSWKGNDFMEKDTIGLWIAVFEWLREIIETSLYLPFMILIHFSGAHVPLFHISEPTWEERIRWFGQSKGVWENSIEVKKRDSPIGHWKSEKRLWELGEQVDILKMEGRHRKQMREHRKYRSSTGGLDEQVSPDDPSTSWYVQSRITFLVVKVFRPMKLRMALLSSRALQSTDSDFGF